MKKMLATISFCVTVGCAPSLESRLFDETLNYCVKVERCFQIDVNKCVATLKPWLRIYNTESDWQELKTYNAVATCEMIRQSLAMKEF